jgi:hypothetical protein
MTKWQKVDDNDVNAARTYYFDTSEGSTASIKIIKWPKGGYNIQNLAEVLA